jgi:hypothetical protein
LITTTSEFESDRHAGSAGILPALSAKARKGITHKRRLERERKFMKLAGASFGGQDVRAPGFKAALVAETILRGAV